VACDDGGALHRPRAAGRPSLWTTGLPGVFGLVRAHAQERSPKHDRLPPELSPRRPLRITAPPRSRARRPTLACPSTWTSFHQPPQRPKMQIESVPMISSTPSVNSTS
jgi:hypothetical protein